MASVSLDPDASAQLRRVALTVGVLLVLMWAALFANIVSGGWLTAHVGIRPRRAVGLVGIPFAPFLHTGVAHLATSSLAFALLSAITIARHGLREYALVSFAIVALGGAGTWAVGRDVPHLGASGWMAGLLGFLLVVGVRQVGCQRGCPPRRIDCSLSTLQDLAVAGCALFVSSSLLWGRAPAEAGVSSWELHACSFTVGCVAGEVQARHILRLEAEEDGGVPARDTGRRRRSSQRSSRGDEAPRVPRGSNGASHGRPADGAGACAARLEEGDATLRAARHHRAAREWSQLRHEAGAAEDDRLSSEAERHRGVTGLEPEADEGQHGGRGAAVVGLAAAGAAAPGSWAAMVHPQGPRAAQLE
ncbi:hypothetical protein KFE25_001817 [Diacronema lutheri]|uniref:Peptidase S54 rhomboid domain-containing protein n=1 Tax=Diacronema lutheri TaxID=2081491 RepID=A0A8J6C7S6_DIALT|nr:hypothetical protein KFE25_001817 [Diacronema lutheri]